MGKRHTPIMVEFEEIFDEEPEPQPQKNVSAPKPEPEAASKQCRDNIVGQAQRGGVKIDAKKGEELDKAAKEEAWHWKEIDLTQFIRERLSTIFKHQQVAKTHNVEVETFKAEHWGEAMATQRKGKGKLIANFRVDVKWRGKLRLGESVVASCQGTIRFPEVNSEKSPEEWEIKAVCDGEDASAMRMLNPCGSLEETQLRELEPAEQEIKSAMLTTAPQRVLHILTEFMSELFNKANAPCNFEAAAASEPDNTNSEVPEHIQEQVREQMEKMRVESLPEKFRQAIDQIKANEVERIELSVSRITDCEMIQVAKALESNDALTSLDLSHNEISDLGIQGLVTSLAMGGAKGLKELRIISNKYGAMGKTMLGGMCSMRKELKLVYDKE